MYIKRAIKSLLFQSDIIVRQKGLLRRAIFFRIHLLYRYKPLASS